MNITEKILARASGKEKLEPGDVIFANVDKVMLHDVSGPGVIKTFEKLEKDGVVKIDKLFDPSMVWVAEDHFVPSADKISAENISILTKFTDKFGIKKHYKYGLGQYGICHTLSHEEGLVSPGELYIGGDSHTNTTGALGAFACGLGHTDVAYVLLYGNLWFKVPKTLYFKISGKLPDHVMAKDLILKIIGDITTDGGAGCAMQFGGSGISEMSVESRLTLTNMTTEAGAKNGIIEPDQKVFDYLAERGVTEYNAVYDDDGTQYEKTFEYDVSELEPLVAKPFSPQNVSVVQETTGIEIDKSYIGSCTGAKYEDLVAVAKILKGRKVKVRTEVVPAAISIYKKAAENGLDKIFLDAGAVIGAPTCGACCGAHMGVLAKDEVCVSTTNRNFPGRMGHIDSKTYLTSPLVAAASAVTGKLTDPRDL
ncbi:MAG: 3-isopropylmalate dehydratase [Thaumarchaeota archaeon]|jgi:3-isopropylmalate/(R)-2-methylmalate dehydratase large subunit|nr:MAG: 3-isopropylmalate dehydratase [Nitrososphaerota archaeon]HIA97171.1 3-isopropylmalate dehydratase large subunit [Candidatus Nitrosopelagicus sp.]HIC05588.1 3-isopropylmalate dehydratase large subunit [Candidatus Nitrosopelagicus sp.]HIO84834.1 3-isopropylmalate dehydratase large subunit [Candidatus Nitrosopelagicus sp.]|tara:strand:+ start:3570 stop:4841 length:1272 start_codon:yes stop_codon:yes gene_type:complete